jgi:hypothetical protein
LNVSVSVSIDGLPTPYKTPCTFGLSSEIHTLTVPDTDSEGHPFIRWSMGSEKTTITVSRGGIYTAYYGISPPSNYDVKITAILNSAENISVAIKQDGFHTHLNTSQTFTGLTGTHTFTVPYTDEKGHWFTHWIIPDGSTKESPTIQVTAGGTYTAHYDNGLCRFVTPSDQAVTTAATNKSWAEMLDYVSSRISYGNNTNWQFPNETLATGFGQCRDYSTLYTSMLRTQGYSAYVVVGTTNSSGAFRGHVWVVFDLNGTLVHVEPQKSIIDQQFVNFTAYDADYYFDEVSFSPPTVSEDLPLPGSPVETPVTPSTNLNVVPAALFLVITHLTTISIIVILSRKARILSQTPDRLH